MVQSEVLNRVFRIRFAGSAATAFTLEHDNVQFLVTAKHFFKDAQWPSSATVELLMDGTYKSIPVDIKYPKDARIDIAVLKTNPYQIISQFMGNNFTSAGLIFGQEVYFLGYPYNYDSLLVSFPDNNSPTPFIKKACMSGLLAPSPSILFLDGHNNPGFSGGPVCFKKAGDDLFTIAGVVSGYRFSKSPVYDKDDKETDHYIKENTGIINAADISFAVNVAKDWVANP